MKAQISSQVPRCYVLDEDFRVKLAVRSSGDDPLNSFYTPECPIDALPRKIEEIVRNLTANWGSPHCAKNACEMIEGLVISVTPLHGAAGRHIGVFVRDAA